MKRRFGKSIVVSFLCVLCLSAFVPLLSHPLSLPLMNRPTDNKSTATTSKGQSFASENGFLAPLNAPIPMTNYTINAYLQHSSQIVNGITSINYVNHADIALDEIYFRIYPNAFRPHGWLDITEVYHQGSLLSYFVTGVDQTILIVDLVAGSGPGAVVPGANVTLVIYWQVKVPERNDRFGWSNSSDPDFLAYNMGNWHPIVAVFDERGWHTSPYTHMGESFYSDVATYNVYITVPDNFIIAATGQLAAISVGSGVKTWQFQTEPVRDFTWCASPNYQTASILTNGVNVTSYFIADHFAGGQRVLEVAEECLTIFGGYFGLYAWDNLHIVETDFWAGGMEYPQLIMIGSSLYGAPEGLSYLAIVTAHEMGHEWIPFSFGTDSYTEPWIDEGFASFVEYIWVESIYGTTDQEEYRLGDFDRYWTYVAEEGDRVINQSMAFWETTDWYAYGRIVYAKSALVYEMLRHQLGDETFYQAWQNIYEQALHRNIRARALQEYFEAAANESLDWFFNQWVYGSGVITLSLGAISVQQDFAGWTITFELLQEQSVPIRLRVPVGITFSTRAELFWVWMEADSTSTHVITVSEFPLMITLDPQQYLLCQYGISSVNLTIAPGSPVALVITGVAIGGIIVGVVILLWRRRQSMGGSSQKMRTHVIMWF